MTTNSKEYQKVYQKEYRKTHPQKQYRKKKVKIEVKKVKISDLIPPKVETSVKQDNPEQTQGVSRLTGENSVKSEGRFDSAPRSVPPEQTDSKTFRGIDFHRIADLSSFRMFISEVFKTSLPGFEGVPTRGKKKVITQAFNKRILYWKEVQEEMKIVLEARRKKNE